jgi:hypothetical protein
VADVRAVMGKSVVTIAYSGYGDAGQGGAALRGDEVFSGGRGQIGEWGARLWSRLRKLGCSWGVLGWTEDACCESCRGKPGRVRD